VDDSQGFAQIFLDLDNFKAFNDCYGFPRGDTAISAVAEVLIKVIESHGVEGDFVGHIGGDDFWVITTPDRAEDLAEAIKGALELRMPELYDEEDRAQGFVRVLNRRREFEESPLMSVTIIVAEYDPKSGVHLAAVDDLIKELKTYGKGLPGSVVVTERRRHGAVTPSANGDAPAEDPAGESAGESNAAEPVRPARGRKSNAS
jgi:GGDEF domain-containing protein